MSHLLKELAQRASSMCKDNKISTYLANVITVAKQMEQEFQEQGLEKSALFMKQKALEYEESLAWHQKSEAELIKKTQKATDEVEQAFGKKAKPSTLNEPELADDYPMYVGYYYIADGKVIVAEINCNVGRAKNMFGYNKVCRCDMVERGLSPLEWIVK